MKGFKVTTLEYEINVPVHLLISEIFSHRYALISDGTFIKIRIFRNSKIANFESPNCDFSLLKDKSCFHDRFHDFYRVFGIYFMESNDRNMATY